MYIATFSTIELVLVQTTQSMVPFILIRLFDSILHNQDINDKTFPYYISSPLHNYSNSYEALLPLINRDDHSHYFHFYIFSQQPLETTIFSTTIPATMITSTMPVKALYLYSFIINKSY